MMSKVGGLGDLSISGDRLAGCFQDIGNWLMESVRWMDDRFRLTGRQPVKLELLRDQLTIGDKRFSYDPDEKRRSADFPDSGFIVDAIRQSDMAGAEIDVRLGRDFYLVHSLKMPTMPRGRLQKSLQLQLRNLVPIAGMPVYWDHIRQGRVEEEDQVNLALVKAEPLDRLLEAITSTGARVCNVRADVDDAGRKFDFLRRNPHFGRRQSWIAPLLILCLLLSAGSLWWRMHQEHDRWLADRQIIVDGQEADIRQVRTNLAEIEQLQLQLDRVEGFADQGQALRVLDKLSKILPDGTWLDGLTLQGAKVQLEGYSSDASQLIALVEAVPAFRNARFRSSVIRDNTSQAEKFSIEFLLSSEEGE